MLAVHQRQGLDPQGDHGHTAPFYGIAPSGNPIAFSVMDVLRIEDGKIVEHWAVADQLSLLKQLGVIP